MILFHGSNIEIYQIDLTKSKPNKDFGKGFYLSDDEQQAIDMAKFKAQLLGGKPIVSRFEFDQELLNSNHFRVKIFSEYSEEWADFVFTNREGMNVCDEYDIIYGPIANDKVGLQLRKLKDGTIDKSEFLNRLKFMKGITFQYFFGTNKAISFLNKIV